MATSSEAAAVLYDKVLEIIKMADDYSGGSKVTLIERAAGVYSQVKSARGTGQ